jgi:hypothetical protein
MDSNSWERVKEILTAALKLEASERQAFVREQCRDNPALANGVLELLANDRRTADDPFERPPQLQGADLGLVHTTDSEQVDLFDDLTTGARIGDYTIIDRIGEGGMGQVFLARDPGLRRRVALKCLLSSTDAGIDRARILEEAIAAAAISHTNVATVYHVVEQGERAFIVMEYVEGETLAVKLRRARLPMEAVVDIGRQLAAALNAAHLKGVVHRDIKPSNIQIAIDGSVKVLDFGVARTTRVVSSGASGATTTASSPRDARAGPIGNPGTPPYMSPEQLCGDAVDERSDLFSLGVVLFEMATGRRPFAGTEQPDIIAAQESGAGRAETVDARVPAPLANAIARALELDVTRRFQSAAEVAVALEAVAKTLSPESSDRRDLVFRWAARIAVGVPLVILALGAIGWFKTTVFNYNFGRTGPFARFGVESWREYLGWGLVGLGSKSLVMTVIAVIVASARGVLRASEAIGPIGRLGRTVRRAGRNLVSALGLDKSATLAQVFAGVGILMIIGLGWHHADLINAWIVSFNSAPIEMLLPMRESAPARGSYQAELSVVTLGLLFGLYKVGQLRRREGARDGKIPIVALFAVTVATILMNEAPYRSFNYRDFERADLAGAHCYVIGESGDEVLVLCPGSAPPRNRAVSRDDPNLKRLGTFENVFRGVRPNRP